MSDQARAHVQGSYGTELEQSHKTSELYSELPKKPPVQGKQLGSRALTTQHYTLPKKYNYFNYNMRTSYLMQFERRVNLNNYFYF